MPLPATAKPATVTPPAVAALFREMVEKRASDLFVKAGSCPSLRVDGKVVPVSKTETNEAFVKELLATITAGRAAPPEDAMEFDLAVEFTGIGRFRCNVFHQQGNTAFAFRHIQARIPTLEDLNLPSRQLQKLAALKRGLILVTGVAGSGKSTTIAAMLEFVNQTRNTHIVTIEDPIEFIFDDKQSLVTQREIGLDTSSFTDALKYVVRQSPDVILIGEMRDKDTMEAAISAAETGHLVFSTLHTVNAIQTVERIVTFFPPHQHDLLRLQLSMVLQGVISQRLIPKHDGRGRVPAAELMVSTPTIREILEQGRTKELYRAIQEGSEYYGTQTFNMSLRALYQSGVISLEEAMAAADNPDELKLEIRGIQKGTKAADLS